MSTLQIIISMWTALVFTLAAAPSICIAATQANMDAASSFLNITEFDRRISSQFEMPNTGIPAFDNAAGAMKATPAFQLMRARKAEVMPALRSQLVEIYANKFDENELVTLNTFYRSPVGRKYVTLLPELQLAESKMLLEAMLKSEPKLTEGLEAGTKMQVQADANRAKLEEQAKAGDREAMYRLGGIYCSSPGLSNRKESLAKCFEWKMRAAEGGLAEAQYDIGFSYIDGRYGSPKSGVEMFKWLKRAADQGQTNSMFYVGSAYAGNLKPFGNQPIGVEVRAKDAEFWLQKSAQGGSMGAITDLASMYLEGRVIERNIPQAIHWYTVAAEKRNNFAMRKLGEIYESGLYVAPNLPEAMKWYKQAAGVPK